MFGVPSTDWRGLGKVDIDLGREGAEPKRLRLLPHIFITVSDVLTALCNTLRRKKVASLPY